MKLFPLAPLVDALRAPLLDGTPFLGTSGRALVQLAWAATGFGAAARFLRRDWPQNVSRIDCTLLVTTGKPSSRMIDWR